MREKKLSHLPKNLTNLFLIQGLHIQMKMFKVFIFVKIKLVNRVCWIIFHERCLGNAFGNLK